MNNNKELYSFLSNFRPNHIKDVIDDLTLIDNGYKIIYIVDTYDLINYALPFTDDVTFRKENKNALSHKTIAYDYFFENKGENNVIILDEYKIELLSIKNEILGKLSAFPRIKKQLFDLLQHDEIINESNITNAVRLIKNNFDIIIALQIFIEYGDNIYQRFFNLWKDSISIFNFNSGDPELDNIITKVFDENRPSDIAENLFEAFVKDINTFLYSLNTDLDRHIYLENSYRDIAVIDRIIKTNNTFKTKYPDKLVRFRYLSSAPFKTEKLFSLLSDMELLKYDTNINRNIFQCYLLKSLSKLNKKSPGSSIKTLSLLHEVLAEKEYLEKCSKYLKIESPPNASLQNDVLSDRLMELINQSANDVKNTFIYSAYKRHRDNLSDAINNIKNPEYRNRILDFFKKTDDYMYKDSSLTENLGSPSINIQKFRQSFILANSYNSEGKFVHELNLPFGMDIIRSTFHHLPVLLFLHEKGNKYIDSLHVIFNLILVPINLKENDTDKFNNSITKIILQISSLSAKSLKETTLEFLILTYINLITKAPLSIGKTVQYNISKSETEILSELQVQRDLLRRSSMVPVVDLKEQKLSYKYSGSEYLKEIDYLILWLKRRNTSCWHEKRKEDEMVASCPSCNYNDVIKFGKKCIKNYPDDGRFYHGLALAYHSKAYGVHLHCKKGIEDKDDSIKLFKSARRNLKIAISQYKEIAGTMEDGIPLGLLQKNIIALHNTIADGKLREYEFSENKKPKNLAKVEDELNVIKEYFKKINDDSLKYPSITHTEAELAYNQAKSHYDKEKYEEAWSKIIKATTIISNFEQAKYQIAKNLWKITNKISNLQRDIFAKMQF